jgi:CRP-like cAMP-binding protein
MCRACAGDPLLSSECRRLRGEALRRFYLFTDLEPELLDQVLERTRESELGAEQWLCFHGDEARSFFLVVEGEVALLRHAADGDEVVVTIVGPGELFAEDLAFLDAAVHPLSARALGPARVAQFDRLHFRSLLDREPRLLHKLLHTLHRRNALLIEELERFTIQSASERLLSFLERQTAGSREPVPLRISKRILASRLGMRPETLSRVLAQLKACHRLAETDGCLLVLRGEDGSEPCEACPARLWGCPGPVRPERRTPADADAALEHGTS